MATITRASDREREQLRRSALGADQGPTDEQQAGLPYPPGFLRQRMGDPRDPTNVSFPFLRRMMRDHIVSMGTHFIEVPCVSAPFYYQCDDARVAAFNDKVVRPIYGDLMMLILRIISMGYSPGAINFDVVNPEWTYIDENGDVKKVWDNGSVGAVIVKSVEPLKPETASISWDARGQFNGINYDVRYGVLGGGFVIDGHETPKIDKLHSLWAVHGRMKEDGSPYGWPRIAHCAPIFWMFSYIWDLLARAFEDSADPGPLVRYPREPDSLDDGGVLVDNARLAVDLGTRKRSGSTLALPSDVYKDYTDKPSSIYKWDLQYPEHTTDFTALMDFIGYLEAAKLKGLWIPDQGLQEGTGGSSSRNVASEFGDQRDASQRVTLKQATDVIVQQINIPITRMAFPDFAGELELKVLGLGDDENDLVRQVFQLMGQQDYRRFGIDLRRLAESEGFPMLDPKAFQKEMQDAKREAVQRANTAPPPTVTPTQGRRSLVTQTGFGEMVYQQLGGQINLEEVAFAATEDGDFVSSLPAIDVFDEASLKLEARRLRARSQAYLAWAYRDFAIYLRKRDSELALADEELLKPGPREVAERLVKAWRPSQQKVDAYAKSVATSLRRAYEATAARHALKLSSKRATIDDSAATWLSERGAFAVSSVEGTTREQLADALADGVREGKSAKEIAADMTAQFERLPSSRAAVIARTELGEAYNYATVRAGETAGVKTAQLVDGEGDDPCKERNGKLVPLAQAAKERLNHPCCTFYIRLLPRAPEGLSVRREALEGDVGARFDAETSTILISVDLDRDDEATYLLALAPAFE